MKPIHTVDIFICDVVLGQLSLRLILTKDPKMGGWTYAVLDLNNDTFLVPQSPVADFKTGKHCAEAVIKENFAFSQVNFRWQALAGREASPRAILAKRWRSK